MSYNTVWWERADSRAAKIGRSDPSAQLHFVGKNRVAPDDDTDAYLSLLSILPLVYPGYYYVALTFRGIDVKPTGGGLYEATVDYSRQDPLFSFDTGGGTQKITQAIVQRGVYGVSGALTAMSVKLTIGSPNVFVLGADLTTGLSAGMVVTDSAGAIPGGTTIASVTDSTHLVLTANATKSTGNPVALQCSYDPPSATLTVLPSTLNIVCDITDGSTTATITFDQYDTDALYVGAPVAGPAGAIAMGCTVAAIIDEETFTLSIPATATGKTALAITSGDNATLLAVGTAVKGKGMAPGALVSSVTDATHVVLTAAPTQGSPLFGNPITFSEQEILTFFPASNPPPDFHGAINVKDDTVEGVEVEVPSGHFELTYHVNPAVITDDYQLMLEAMTGTVNSDVFRRRQPGEVKFLGARGSQKGQEDFEITFRFARNPNATNLKVGPITVALKLGWDYLWVRYQKQVDPNANVMLSVPQWAVVDQVFPMVPFAALGIGN